MLQSNNLYGYCRNNPLMYVDGDGKVFMLVTGAIGAVGGGIFGAVKSYVATGEISFGAVVAGAAIGGAIGLTCGAAAGVVLAGSAVAPMGLVVAGASTLVGTVASGGITAGGAYIVHNIQHAFNILPPTTVLGSYPKYLQLGNQLGTNTFSIPTSVWNAMSQAEQWAMNQSFLDKSIQAGNQFILSNSAYNAVEGTYFYREIQYLLEHGYEIINNGFKMIQCGG